MKVYTKRGRGALSSPSAGRAIAICSYAQHAAFCRTPDGDLTVLRAAFGAARWNADYTSSPSASKKSIRVICVQRIPST